MTSTTLQTSLASSVSSPFVYRQHVGRGRWKIFFASLLLLAAVGGAVGCSAGDGDESDDGDQSSGGSEVAGDAQTLRSETDGDGVAGVEFQIPDGATKFSVVAESTGNDVRFEQLSDDEGNDFLSPGGVPLTLSEEFFPHLSVVNAPSRAGDPDVGASRRYQAFVTVAQNGFLPVEGASVAFRINSRQDPDFDSGTLTMNFFYVGGAAQTADAKAAVGLAIEEMRRIFREANIRVELTQFDIDGPSVLPSPVSGSSFYKSASAQGPAPAVNIFVGGDIEIDGVLGLAAAIPGPAIPTERSAVAVSLVTGAGTNGEFSDLEIRLLGETMAHEGSHLMGLLHPVDFVGSSVQGVDPLSDTPTCSDDADCRENESLIRNLMYPEPISDGAGGLVPQNALTAQQRGVLNRYIAVD